MLKKVPIMPVWHSKKFAVGDGERLVRVLFYTVLGFDSLQSVSTAPQLLRFPQGGIAMILCFRAKSEGLGTPAK